jgi:hypothetical protein
LRSYAGRAGDIIVFYIYEYNHRETNPFVVQTKSPIFGRPKKAIVLLSEAAASDFALCLCNGSSLVLEGS